MPRELRFGLPGRITSEGTEAEPFDPAAAKNAAKAIAEAGCESVAVCLLFSFLDPAHELAVRDAFASLGIPVSLSHEILAEFREFERTSTTVINAYVSPKMTRYLTRLHRITSYNVCYTKLLRFLTRLLLVAVNVSFLV